ncbi:hypothetical protein DPX16_23699 [Anabarilius grahami]|uniref:Uncharacterized protein n=1 Tax=Anabarilius grahami TaxID=495550 RepID=A0A3N0Y8C3_ANAGA|nr:hypothetical protein DPX16_23699 [Anabarilius grahami]
MQQQEKTTSVHDADPWLANASSASASGQQDADNINEVRASMFVKGMTTERLPPTRDALYFHIQCSHFQALVWRQAHLQQPVLPPLETMGWKTEGNSLIPQLMSLPPVPDACEE